MNSRELDTEPIDWFANVVRTAAPPTRPASREAEPDGERGHEADPLDRPRPKPFASLLGRLKRTSSWFVGLSAAVLVALLATGLILGLGLGDDEPRSETSDRAADQPDDSAPGSLGSPYPFGLSVTLAYNDLEIGQSREWRVEVLASELAEAGQGQDSPMVRTRIRLTYQRGLNPAPLDDIDLATIGESGTVYAPSTQGCGEGSEDFDDGQLEVGQTIEGWICWPVTDGDVASLVLSVEAEPADGVLYMELQDTVDD